MLYLNSSEAYSVEIAEMIALLSTTKHGAVIIGTINSSQ